MSLTAVEMREMEARCERAAPGPWQLPAPAMPPPERFVLRAAEAGGPRLALSGAREEDARFLARAREDVPRLLDELRWLRALLDALHAGEPGPPRPRLPADAESVIGAPRTRRQIARDVMRASPAPWRARSGWRGDRIDVGTGPGSRGAIRVHGATPDDLAFLTHAREDVPRLLDAVDALRDEGRALARRTGVPDPLAPAPPRLDPSGAPGPDAPGIDGPCATPEMVRDLVRAATREAAWQAALRIEARAFRADQLAPAAFPVVRGLVEAYGDWAETARVEVLHLLVLLCTRRPPPEHPDLALRCTAELRPLHAASLAALRDAPPEERLAHADVLRVLGSTFPELRPDALTALRDLLRHPLPEADATLVRHALEAVEDAFDDDA